MEDLTTYTEVDFYNDISVTSERATANMVLSNRDAYLYKDFGANHFDGISLKFSGGISSSSYDDPHCYVGFANMIDDVYAWGWTNVYPRIAFSKWDDPQLGVHYHIGLYASASILDGIEISPNTIYYLTLTRPAGGDTATLKIYTDSARTVLFDTLTVSGLGTTKWRYFYPLVNENTGDTNDVFVGYFENFLFGSPACGQVRVIGMAM